MITRFKRWWYRKEITEWRKLIVVARLNAMTREQKTHMHRLCKRFAKLNIVDEEKVFDENYDLVETNYTLRREYDV